MTSVDLTMTITLSPALISRSLTDSLVITEVIVSGVSISILTLAMIAPSSTLFTVPLIWFLALNFNISPSS